MEVKINREIRDYTESMFFGLSMRQFVCTMLAVATSVISYFLLKSIIGIEAVSWICVLAAVPFAVLGFVKYNGMNAEQFIQARIKSEVLIPKYLCFGNSNLYMELLREADKEKKSKKNKKKRRKHRK